MGSVYLVQNTFNGKCYVGATCRPCNIRWNEHIKGSCTGTSYFSRALRKHGVENFEWSVLSTHGTISETFTFERELIEYFRFVGAQLYNLSPGGDGRPGEMNGRAVLKERDVKEIREEWNAARSDMHSWADKCAFFEHVALQYNLCSATIHGVIIGSLWAHVPMPYSRESTKLTLEQKSKNTRKALRIYFDENPNARAGERNPNSSLNEQLVASIRDDWNIRKPAPQSSERVDFLREWSKRCDVTSVSILNAALHKTWQHVTTVPLLFDDRQSRVSIDAKTKKKIRSEWLMQGLDSLRRKDPRKREFIERWARDVGAHIKTIRSIAMGKR